MTAVTTLASRCISVLDCVHHTKPANTIEFVVVAGNEFISVSSRRCVLTFMETGKRLAEDFTALARKPPQPDIQTPVKINRSFEVDANRESMPLYLQRTQEVLPF